MEIGNLPGNQLSQFCEVLNYYNNDEYVWDEEDDIPLASFRRPTKRVKRQQFSWMPENVEVQKGSSEELLYSCVENNPSPLEMFQYFFDEDVFNMLVVFTNNYAQNKNHIGNVSKDELKVFVGVLLVSGYSIVSRRRMYWETSDDTHNKTIADAISRNRFDYIMAHLHCCDNYNLDKNNKFAKMTPLFEELNTRFLQFAPVQINYSVDEAMIEYFGRHPTKQFIRGKPIRWGYKFWVGATPLGYIVWFSPYQGAEATLNAYADMNLGTKVVLNFCDTLIKRQLGIKYHIFCDNFFPLSICLRK